MFMDSGAFKEKELIFFLGTNVSAASYFFMYSIL